MHESVLRWLPTALGPEEIAGANVLEVGAYDVNGSVRPDVERHLPGSYLGVDQTPGPRVDQVVDCHHLVAELGAARFDVVISTETLEHVEDWQRCVAQLCEMVRPGGLLLLTTRSPGFPYHPFPVDRWRYTVDAMRDLLTAAGLRPEMVERDPQHPGVFARARKPPTWSPPWAARPLAEVFAGVDVREAP